jgi:hypothetical protein
LNEAIEIAIDRLVLAARLAGRCPPSSVENWNRDQQAAKDRETELRTLIANELLQTVHDNFSGDDNVVVYDRYRFVAPVTGTVSNLSRNSDGVAVTLTSTNNPHYPVGSEVWVSAKQLRKNHD